MLNFIKIVSQSNVELKNVPLEKYFTVLDKNFKPHIHFYIQLLKWKKEKGAEPDDIIERTKNFMNFFFNWVEEYPKKLSIVAFIRHGKTELNDGSFLGIGRNPGLNKNQKFDSLDIQFDKCYSSNLKRSKETLEKMGYNNFESSNLLNEINYGDAEGMTIKELIKSFPDIQKKWNQSMDPSFPNGENQQDVLNRLKQFIQQYIYPNKNLNILIVSHLVVLRMLIQYSWQIGLHKCFLIQIDHLERLNFYINDQVLIPNFTKEQRIKFRNQISSI